MIVVPIVEPCVACTEQTTELDRLRTELAKHEFDPAKFASKVWVIESSTCGKYLSRDGEAWNTTRGLADARKWSVKGEAAAFIETLKIPAVWYLKQPTPQEILAAEARAAAEWAAEREGAGV